MSDKIIAVIKLAPGQIGWYDDITGIHLTMKKTAANVYSGSNTTNLLKGLKDNKIELISGSLTECFESAISSYPLNRVVVDTTLPRAIK